MEFAGSILTPIALSSTALDKPVTKQQARLNLVPVEGRWFFETKNRRSVVALAMRRRLYIHLYYGRPIWALRPKTGGRAPMPVVLWTVAHLPTVPVGAYPTLTGQFADKPTRGKSSRGLVNSPGKTTLYFYTEPKPHPYTDTIDYWRCSVV